ncbi:ribbon-helix-helix protein, CopG family [Corallococcus sp. M34]|uniref:ribbon-helix-helix domain-containing protein n=1 Tax=Citreicoccus inhibens TaxID=2849499 RepID=UPI001C23A402|nr:ribbon-helix-helix domain-containing protein [Citreicoccus inhibens]MBU8901014.1 ribbon-helix-helix protein, CopG family [Citreicoccus inhibens]
MPRTTAKTKKLESLNLTELRARYREVVGEETRSPNKVHLIRRIEESLAAKKQRSPSRQGAAIAPSTPLATPAAQATPSSAEATPPSPQRGRFANMPLEALQAEYRKVLGRPTSSSNVGYLRWKIREAEAGRVPVGPRLAREAKVREDGKRVIPLSFGAEALEGLDKTWRNAGMPSRTEFFRRAIRRYLVDMGAPEAAALFAQDAE